MRNPRSLLLSFPSGVSSRPPTKQSPAPCVRAEGHLSGQGKPREGVRKAPKPSWLGRGGAVLKRPASGEGPRAAAGPRRGSSSEAELHAPGGGVGFFMVFPELQPQRFHLG